MTDEPEDFADDDAPEEDGPTSGTRAHLGLRPGGRSERVRAAILDATAAELLEVGYGHLGLPAVAARAGVAVSTVRRRWSTPALLVADTLVEATAEQVPTPDLGTLELDLRAFARSVADYHAEPRTHALLRATLALPPLQLQEVRARTWVERARVSRQILRRALERGEIPRQRDAARIVEMLIAPIWLRSLVTGAAIVEADLDEFVADALAAAGYEPTAPARPITPEGLDANAPG